mgnify:CR=1 FL=1
MASQPSNRRGRALKAKDMEAYRIYNGICTWQSWKRRATSCLSSAMGQLTLQSQMLMAKTIRLVGRPASDRGSIADLIELIAKRKDKPARALSGAAHPERALTTSFGYGISKRIDGRRRLESNHDEIRRRRPNARMNLRSIRSAPLSDRPLSRRRRSSFRCQAPPGPRRG